MRQAILGVFILAVAALVVGCAISEERQGQRLFAGCLEGVDDKATLKSGEFVCKGPRDPEPFAGNGRTCGDCHVPGDNFGLSIQRIGSFPDEHPFFYPGLDEDQQLLKAHGLVNVVAANINELRQSPKLIHLQTLCDKKGNCDALGLMGDRSRNLCAFSIEAISNHMAKTVMRIPGKDFRVPTSEECEALVAYMVSDLVAKQDERKK